MKTVRQRCTEAVTGGWSVKKSFCEKKKNSEKNYLGFESIFIAVFSKLTSELGTVVLYRIFIYSRIKT